MEDLGNNLEQPSEYDASDDTYSDSEPNSEVVLQSFDNSPSPAQESDESDAEAPGTAVNFPYQIEPEYHPVMRTTVNRRTVRRPLTSFSNFNAILRPKLHLVFGRMSNGVKFIYVFVVTQFGKCTGY